MKKWNFYSVLLVLFVACTSPEKRALQVLESFNQELKTIADVENLSAYDLHTKLNESYASMQKAHKEARKQLKGDEEKERFDEVFDIDSVPLYFSLLETLTNKNLTALDGVKGKYWIKAGSDDIKTVFTLDNHRLSFLNLKNKFAYEVVNGRVVFDEKSGVSPLFFEPDGESLVVRKNDGTEVRYKEVVGIENIIQGEWGSLGSYITLTFQKNKNFIANIPLAGEVMGRYQVNGKNITFKPKDSDYASTMFGYIKCRYISLDKITRSDDINDFFRHTSDGPAALNFLFDGNLKNTEKEKTQVRYSSSKNKSSNVSSSKKSNDWDSILDDYEEYYDKYVDLFKKAQNGDMSALTEYASMLEKAQSIGEKLSAAQDELTSAQASRFLKIQQKLLNAVSGL